MVGPLHSKRFTTRRVEFDEIASFYNLRRLHWNFGYVSPETALVGVAYRRDKAGRLIPLLGEPRN